MGSNPRVSSGLFWLSVHRRKASGCCRARRQCKDDATRPLRRQAAEMTSLVEILAQRRSGICLLRQSAALQLRYHELDELAHVIHRGIAAAENEAAIGAGAEMHLLELVDNRFRRAGRNQDAVDQEAAGELLQ